MDEVKLQNMNGKIPILLSAGPDAPERLPV